MLNQVSTIGLGSNASYIAAAVKANERLGAVTFMFENTGDNDAYIQLKELVGSGYNNLGSGFTLKARGTTSKELVLISNRVGVFGSGNTTINLSTVLRNPANLRGAQIDIEVLGKRGYGKDIAINQAVLGIQPTAPVL